MKGRYLVLGIMVAIAAIASRQASAGKGSGGIPFPVGQFSSSL
jgi:hypothetical protein